MHACVCKLMLIVYFQSGFLAPIKVETVTEVSGVCSVIKEEVIVGNLHNEDINEVVCCISCLLYTSRCV